MTRRNTPVLVITVVALVAAAGVTAALWRERSGMTGRRRAARAPTPRESVAPQAEPEPRLETPLVSPRIVVLKAERRLELYSAGKRVRRYRIGLSFEPEGDKEREGDGRTPEGEFYVCNLNRDSKDYLSLGLSYPNAEDAARGLAAGLVTKARHDRIVAAIERGGQPAWDTALGGEIFIHGCGASRDWTWGCIALEDPDVRELFDAVPVGTPVLIKP